MSPLLWPRSKSVHPGFQRLPFQVVRKLHIVNPPSSPVYLKILGSRTTPTLVLIILGSIHLLSQNLTVDVNVAFDSSPEVQPPFLPSSRGPSWPFSCTSTKTGVSTKGVCTHGYNLKFFIRRIQREMYTPGFVLRFQRSQGFEVRPVYRFHFYWSVYKERPIHLVRMRTIMTSVSVIQGPRWVITTVKRIPTRIFR